MTQTPAGLAPHPHRSYRYYDLVMAAFVTVLLCANLIGAAKVAQVGGFTFGAGVLFFPISYVFGDVLTEVYGYARARKVVWAGFGALAFASFMSWATLAFPPAPGWPHQAAYETVFGGTPRIVLASLVAYFCGEFCNSYVLAKMKLATGGRLLWSRTIGSTIVGEAVDSAVFYPLAFLGAWETDLVVRVMVSNYFLKVAWEVVMTPFTYRVVNFLKRAESEDYFDREHRLHAVLARDLAFPGRAFHPGLGDSSRAGHASGRARVLGSPGAAQGRLVPPHVQLVYPLVFFLLALDVLAHCRLIAPHRGHEVPAGPKVLARVVLPSPEVRPRDVDRALPLHVAHHLRDRVLRRDRHQHVHVVGHQVAFLHATRLLLRKPPEHSPEVFSQLSVQRLASVLRDEHHVVLALPVVCARVSTSSSGRSSR